MPMPEQQDRVIKQYSVVVHPTLALLLHGYKRLSTDGSTCEYWDIRLRDLHLRSFRPTIVVRHDADS